MHEWIPTSEGQTLAQLVTAQEALGNTVLQQDADNSRVLVDTPSGGSGLANALVYKGATDCSTNPNYPAADAGHLYIVSVAGKIGGASGISVEAGDSFICKTDGTLAGTQAQRGASWNVVQGNLAGAIVDGTGAGGVLSGTFPNPGFSVNMATQAELDAAAATIPVKASGAEVDSGVDDAKFVTALALANSDYIKEADLPASGITNAAGANVVPKSDGTDLVASQISDDGGNVTVDGNLSVNALTVLTGGGTLTVGPSTNDINLETGGTAKVILGSGADAFVKISPNSLNQWHASPNPVTIDTEALAKFGDAFGNTFGTHLAVDGTNGLATLGDVDDNAGGTKVIVNDLTTTISLTAVNGINLNSVAKLAPLAFASLPASPAEGMMAWVNDSNTAVWGATVTAGGTDKVLVVFNGTVWTVAGK